MAIHDMVIGKDGKCTICKLTWVESFNLVDSEGERTGESDIHFYPKKPWLKVKE